MALPFSDESRMGVVMKLIGFTALLLPLIAVLSGISAAEDGLKGEITVGAEAVDLNRNSDKHGEYGGVDDNGVRFIGDADLTYEKELYLMELHATDIGLKNRSLSIAVGRPGNYSLKIEYNELVHLLGDGKTPMGGAGTGVLTLPAGFVRDADSASMTTLAADSKIVDLETDRTNGSVSYKRKLRKDMSFAVSFRREKKDGTRSTGGVSGVSGQFTSSIVLPEPVDYTTDDLNASIAYSGKTGQIQLGYYYSRFENDIDSLRWDNPFTEPGGEAYPTTARTSLAPDNIYQRLSLTGGITLPLSTRITVTAERGRMEQDEALLPYTENSLLTVPSPLPESSADAEIDTTHLTLNLASRPTSKLSFNGRYQYYRTKNKTPRHLFMRVVNDTGDNDGGDADGQVDATDSQAAYNNPFDYEKKEMKLDVTYRLPKSARLRFGLKRDNIERDYREVDETEEDAYSFGLTSNSSDASFGFDYARAKRQVEDSYSSAMLYNETHSPSYSSADPNDNFDEHPDIRKFDIADRERENYGINLHFFAGDRTDLGFYYNSQDDEYEKSVLGLQESESSSFTLDITHSPSKYFSMYTFYTKEGRDMTQSNWYFTTAGPPGTKFAQANDPTRQWWADHDDENDTIGVGTKIGLLGNDLTIGADYSYSESTTSITFRNAGNAAFAGAAAIPDLETQMHALKITGRYRYSKRTIFGLGYEFEKYASSDWARDGLDAASGTVAELLTLMSPTPNYKAHLIRAFVSWKM